MSLIDQAEGRTFSLYYRIEISLPEEAPETLQVIKTIEPVGMDALEKIVRETVYSKAKITSSYFIF